MSATLTSINPATGEAVWSGPEATAAEVDAAVARAVEAAERWRRTAIDERIDVLHRYKQALQAASGELQRLISAEVGKPRWESATEVASMVGKVDLTISAFRERRSDVSMEQNGLTMATRYHPHGVVAVPGPFNFPGHLANGHIVPAILCGNAVVFKPSEQAPAVGERMAACWAEAGLPAGVLEVVQGGRAVGEHLVRHPDIAGVFFTGSVAAGLSLHRLLVDRPDKILALELGGNNPLVVHNVGDLDAAAHAIVQSAYLTAGQRCTCARRLIVTSDDVLDLLIRLIRRVRVGPPELEPEPFMGPVISRAAADRLMQAQDALAAQGAEVLVPMRRLGDAMLTPGLIDTTDIARPDEEFFGPLLQLIRAPDLDAAIEEANATRFGLAAGLLSDDAASYERFRSRIRAGIVNWNQQLTGASGRLPFGGVGLSGNFRPSGYFAVDYCSYPVASLEQPRVTLPTKPIPGFEPD